MSSSSPNFQGESDIKSLKPPPRNTLKADLAFLDDPQTRPESLVPGSPCESGGKVDLLRPFSYSKSSVEMGENTLENCHGTPKTGGLVQMMVLFNCMISKASSLQFFRGACFNRSK